MPNSNLDSMETALKSLREALDNCQYKNPDITNLVQQMETTLASIKAKASDVKDFSPTTNTLFNSVVSTLP